MVHISPLFFGVTYYIVLTIVFTPVALLTERHALKEFISNGHMKRMVLPGVCNSIMIAAYMIEISMTKAAYMIAVKRTSLLIGIVYGYFLFGEKNIKERLTGAFLMFTGFVLIITAA